MDVFDAGHQIPVVDGHEMLLGTVLLASDAGEAKVFDLMAGGAERDGAKEFLNSILMIKAPALMAFYGVLGAPSATDFTAVIGFLIACAPTSIPALTTQDGSEVGVPHG